MLERARARLAGLAASADAATARAARGVVRFAGWPLLHAIAIGVGLAVLRRPALVTALAKNQVPPRAAHEVLAWIGASLVGVAAWHVLSIRRARAAARRDGAELPDDAATFARASRRLHPVLAVPLLLALALDGIERDAPKATLFLAALVALVAGVSVAGMDGARLPAREDGSTRTAAAIALGLLWAGYAAFFARLSITNHHALETRTVSLGIYDNILWQTSHGRPLACSFLKAGYHGSAHFDPILILLAPIYRIAPGAETLLVLQSVWLGAGVVPVYLIARAHAFGRAVAVAFAAMYALHPAVHGANLYEFHSLTLAAPIVLGLLWLLETGRTRGYYAALVLALLVREDLPILACFVGAHALLSGRPGAARAGWVTIAASLVYFAVVKRFFMTSPDVFMSGPDAYSFAYNFDEMIPNHDGALGLVVSLLTNPVFVLRNAVTESKLVYLAQVFLPLAFLPFVARSGRILLAWGVLFALLATRPALYSTHFHYPCLLIPVAFALAPAGAARVRDAARLAALGLDGARLARGLVAAAFAASLVLSWKFGGLVANASFRAGYLPVVRELDDEQRATYAWVREHVGAIPPGDSAAATNEAGAHVGNRERAFMYPERSDADWVFVDEAELQGAGRAKHEANVREGRLELAARRGTLALFRRPRGVE